MASGIIDTHVGIDYGMGRANVDRETGIRYGVISQHSLDLQAFHDSVEPVYPGPNCPECGGDVIPEGEVKHRDLWRKRTAWGCFDHACLACRKGFDSGDCYGEEVDGWECNDPDYELTTCLDTDVMVLRSPYYTHAQYCSPCVPGAGSLNSPCKDGPRAYCFGHDWFEGGVAPYPVFRTSDDSEVYRAADGSRVDPDVSADHAATAA